MTYIELNKLKVNFSFYSSAFVYLGGLVHLINFFGNKDIILYLVIGYIIALIFMFNAFFNPVIIFMHNIIGLTYLDDLFPSFNEKLLYFTFYIPFYASIIFSIILLLGFDNYLLKKSK